MVLGVVPREDAMLLACRAVVGFLRGLRSWEDAEVAPFVVHADHRAERIRGAIFDMGNTARKWLMPPSRAENVGLVLSNSRWAKIVDAIIGAIKIGVIDLVVLAKYVTVNPYPRKPVRFECALADLDDDVTISVHEASDGPSLSSVQTGTPTIAPTPHEDAGHRIVIQKRSQSRLGGKWFSSLHVMGTLTPRYAGVN